MSSPALRRIRTIRRTTTAIFAATTAVCLAVLVVLALRIDTSSRLRSLTDGLAAQAAALGEALSFSNGALDLSRLAQTQDARLAPVLGVVTTDAITFAAPDQSALPADDELRRVLAELAAHPGVTSFEARSASGASLHWAAAPVLSTAPGAGTAAVLVGGPVPGAADHERLAVGLAITAAALTVLAAGLGHLVSGFAMRPAVRGLAGTERFLLEASHELRTPLTVLGVVLDEAAAGSTDEATRRDAVGRARRQVDRMASITSTLLLRARADAGTTAVSLEPLRLDLAVEAAVVEAAPGGLEDGRVVLEAPAVVATANAELVQQAVRNLVDNALRHGAAPVRVVVADGPAAPSVEVSDAGPGIAAARRNRMRRPGVGAGDGTGTGLAIVDWVARAHGGSLELGAGPAGGLRARLVLGGGRAARARPGDRAAR